jgi:hypothetical protein
VSPTSTKPEKPQAKPPRPQTEMEPVLEKPEVVEKPKLKNKELLPPPAWLTAAIVDKTPLEPLPLPSPDPVESAPELGATTSAGPSGDAIPV